MIRHISQSLILAGILIMAYVGLIQFFPSLEHSQFYGFLVFFSGLQIIASLAYDRFSKKEDAQQFVTAFLVATGVKFILSLFIVLILVVQFPEQKQLLALSFFSLYIFFLLADSVILLRKIKQRN